MSFEPEIQIVGEKVTVRAGRKTLIEAPLSRVLEEIGRVVERRPSCAVLPQGIRLWYERADATAVAIEVRPQTRTVRWLEEKSRASFGRRARYRERFLAFPYLVLLIVFRGGALTGYQQLYYRRAPLSRDQDLLLPNLYNVAQGYGQRCWLCLQTLESRVMASDWPRKVAAIIDHVFTAAFNRSAEENEGNSYWGAMRDVDPRVASVEAWEQATREKQMFPLEVPWKPAGTTATEELERMLNQVVAVPRLRHARDLMGLMSRTGRR